MKRELRRAHRSCHSSLSELNITPLLDLVFVLLVIFIITTPQLTNSLELSLPAAKPPRPPGPEPKINRVLIDDGGRILLNNQVMTLAQFRVALTQIKLADPDAGVVFRGADEVDYQRVVDVLDVVHQLQITKVGLTTQTIDTKPEQH